MRSKIFLPLLAGVAVMASGCEKELLTAGPVEAVAQQAPAAGEQMMRGPGMGGPGMRGMDPLGRLLSHREELALTGDQVTRLEALASELRARNETLRAQLGTLPEGLRGERARSQRPALSEEQREAMRARREAQRGERAQLTEEQRAELRARMEAQRGGRPALTDEQRATMQARREALRPLMQDLAEQQRAVMAEVQSILTDEQKARLRELRPARPERARARGGAPR